MAKLERPLSLERVLSFDNPTRCPGLSAHVAPAAWEPPTVDACVGNTPLVRLQRLPNISPSNKIYVKLEGSNPGGSAKDRPALSMLAAAEASGALQPGGRVIECTTGNTGIALAMACAARGYKLTIIMPSTMTEERKVLIRAFGADIRLTPTLEAGRDLARAMADAGEGVLLDQNNNPANPRAHEHTTGVEVWQQTGGRVTHFLAGMGTSGTLVGCARALKARNPRVTCIGLEPPESEATSVPGIRRWPEAYRPRVRDDDVIDATMGVTAREAEEMARALARTEGLLLGVSAAGAVSAALRLSARVRNATIVVLACDRGDRYLSTGLFSPEAIAADPAPCPPTELPAAAARLAAYPGPHFIAFPDVLGPSGREGAAGAALREAGACLTARGGTVLEVAGVPDWGSAEMRTLFPGIAAEADAPPALVAWDAAAAASPSGPSPRVVMTCRELVPAAAAA